MSGLRALFRGGDYPHTWGVVVRDAVIIGGFFALLGLAVNLLRSDGLALVAEQPYEILVPCPEPLGEVFPADPSELAMEGSLVIDARYPEDFQEWHYSGAMHVQWDELDPVPKEIVADLIKGGAKRIIVYGDARDPDSGRELARELAGRGARNVFFIEGGAPRLQGKEVDHE